MTQRNITVAAALTMTVAALVPASASDKTSVASADGAFSIPAVIGAAYHERGIALSGADVRAQGGLLVPALTRWGRAQVASPSVMPFMAPATFTVAYRNRNVAANAAEVFKQGGFATAGVVRWLTDAPSDVKVSASIVELGAL